MVGKDGKDCCLDLRKVSIQDMSIDTLVDVEKIKEILSCMGDVTLIDKERYEQKEEIYIPQLVNYYDDYTKRVRREFGDGSDNVYKNREEYKRIEESILDMWNKPPLPKINIFSDERKRHLRQRLINKYFVENYAFAIQKIAASEFCRGLIASTNGKTWKATIDWFLANDNNYVKALEGKYDGKKSRGDV